MRQVGGGVVTCAGSRVQLMPDTKYFREFHNLRNWNITPENFNFKASSYIRETTCDAQGSFKFENLPSGKWIVKTNVSWGVPSTYTISLQGGDVYEFLETKNGISEVIISH